ncbi:hypothetical protein F9C07_2053611 [Aspergillus flavus]|uniref:Uncharacterized protein n=1 Tax=Aspergillus flavus (strain ATCC 200026 / FGSC A1120 / IAM 13836 / NRRL 3357 / JCM 12722 / SRRC 167) TaxID=332952 RepID=A0A7U2QR75_ASPFN|nr:hypothetical protein F9C07_2053611 [Aspergillus flavus]
MASGEKRPQSVEFESQDSKRMTADHIQLLPLIEQPKCASQSQVHASDSTAEVMDSTYIRALEGLSRNSYAEENEDSPKDQVEIMAENSSKVHNSLVDFVIKADENDCLASTVFIIFAEYAADKVFLLGIESGALGISLLLSESLISTNNIEAVAFFIEESPHSRVFVRRSHDIWGLPIKKRAKNRYGVLIPSEEASFQMNIDETLAWMQKAFN